MAAIAGRAEVMAPLDGRRTSRERMAWASGTLNGNPISATAGNIALDVLAEPSCYERLHRIGGRLRREIKVIGERHGIPTQTPGEDAVFGVRFTPLAKLRTWADHLTADKELGRRWAIACLRRGLLVNPNEKFYISIAHSEADVDRTLEIIEAAFQSISSLPTRPITSNSSRRSGGRI
jgi:glutamate-1-semialdehyde 2,1-aminomutase